jgi:hypothetical protein
VGPLTLTGSALRAGLVALRADRGAGEACAQRTEVAGDGVPPWRTLERVVAGAFAAVGAVAGGRGCEDREDQDENQ